MPHHTVFEAKIEHLQILDETGKLDKKLAKDTLNNDQVVYLYEQMRICRALDDIAFKLQRSGRMGTYPQNKGQEANAVGSALAMVKGNDWLVPSYRENAALFMHGMPMHMVIQYWMGDERGSQFPEGVNITPLSVPIGTHMLHATGIAWAMKQRKVKNAAVITYFGDGATSEGDFHNAMNFASVMQVPTIFYCQNNSWAISLPREQQMNSATVAQKAIAYDMPTIRIDGNDIFAVYKATCDARKRAIEGGGPSFIEGVTYRLADHTTADDASRYRDPKEVESWVERDPLIRTRKYMESIDIWDDKKQEELDTRAETIVKEVIQSAISVPEPDKADFFNYMFKEIPDDLKKQRDTMRTTSIGRNPSQIGLKVPAQTVAQNA